MKTRLTTIVKSALRTLALVGGFAFAAFDASSAARTLQLNQNGGTYYWVDTSKTQTSADTWWEWVDKTATVAAHWNYPGVNPAAGDTIYINLKGTVSGERTLYIRNESGTTTTTPALKSLVFYDTGYPMTVRDGTLKFNDKASEIWLQPGSKKLLFKDMAWDFYSTSAGGIIFETGCNVEFDTVTLNKAVPFLFTKNGVAQKSKDSTLVFKNSVVAFGTGYGVTNSVSYTKNRNITFDNASLTLASLNTRVDGTTGTLYDKLIMTVKPGSNNDSLNGSPALNVTGLFKPASGSTLNVDASSITSAGTYNIISYAASSAPDNVTVGTLTLPNGGSVNVGSKKLGSEMGTAVVGYAGGLSYTLKNSTSSNAAAGTLTLTVAAIIDFYWEHTTGVHWNKIETSGKSHWFAAANRSTASQLYSTFPNSLDAQVHLGASGKVVQIKNPKYGISSVSVKNITMEGGTASISEGNYNFPSSASAVVINNTAGTLNLEAADFYGKGRIKCANGTTTKITSNFDDPDLGFYLDGLASGNTVNINLEADNRIGYLQTPISGSTAHVTVKSSFVTFTKTGTGTVGLGGSGKLDLDMTLAQPTNSEIQVALKVNGALSVASGSTLDIDASALTGVGTYKILSYGSVSNPEYLKINSIKLPGASSATTLTSVTLNSLSSSPVAGVEGTYAYLLKHSDNTLTLTLSDKNKYYWSKDEDSSGWDSIERWWSNEERAGSHRQASGDYPNASTAYAYVGFDGCGIKQLLQIQSGTTITIGHLTMNGGPGASIGGGGYLAFPSNSDVSTPIIENNRGTLIFTRLGIQGNGEIRCADGTVTQFSRTPIDTATHKISVSAEGLTGSQSATVNVYANSGSEYAPQNLYYLQTGSSSSSTEYLNISNIVLNLASTTPVSGSGKLAMKMITGAWNANNKTDAFLYAPNGMLAIPAGSTLALDFSDDRATVGSYSSTYTGTYKLLKYGAVSNPGGLTITTLTLPGVSTPISISKTLSTLSTAVTGTAGGYYYKLWHDTTNKELTLTLATPVAKPAVTKSFTYDGQTKTAGSASTGYTVTGNTGTNVGDYTFKATLETGYCWSDGSTGVYSVDWSITEATITAVTLNAASATYDGQPHQPTVKNVTANGKTFADAATGWDVSYKRGGSTTTDFTSAGTITVTVTGKANLTGSQSATYTINTKAMTVSASDYSGTYDGGAHGISVKVSEPSGATVKYGESAGSYTLDASPKITNVADSPKTVYYQITAANYTTVTGSKKITITRANTATEPTAANRTYTGSSQDGYSAAGNHTTLGGTKSATAKGDYSFTATPDANHAWSDGGTSAKTYNWSIAAATITAVTLNATSATYDGQPHQPTVKNVTANEKTFADAATGWDVSYKRGGSTTTDFTSAGTITVTVTGKANLTGSQSATYTINTKAMTVSASGYSGTYDGGAHGISVTVSEPSGATVMYGTTSGSYTTTTNPTYTDAGTYTVYWQVTKANYTTKTGSATVTINRKAVTVKADAKSKTYGAADPMLTATVSGRVKDTDTVLYTVAREAGDNVGTYTITPSGDATQGNYTVTYETGTFTVNRAKTAVGPTVENRTYNGTPQNGYSNAGTYVTLEGTTSATEVGDYSFTATPDANHAWSDGAFGAKTYNWSISYGKGYAITLAGGTSGTSGTALSYDAKGEQQTKTITAPPTRTGYHVKSYASSLAGVSASGSTVTIAAKTFGNATLTPTWEANTYTIGYELGNGGTVTGAPTGATYDAALAVPAPTRTGYTFAGWKVTSGLNTSTAKWGTSDNPSTAIGSSTVCFNTATTAVYFKNLTPTASGSVTLTAQWTANTYNILYSNGTDATAPTHAPTGAAYDEVFYVSAPTRTGYTFAGWKVAKGLDKTTAKWGTSSGDVTTTISKTTTKCVNSATGDVYFKNLMATNGTATLTASWTSNKYTVTLDDNDGSGGSSSVQATYGSNMPTPITLPTRSGYTFAGYCDAKSGGTKYYKTDGSSANRWNKANDATLYAQWTAIEYAITYEEVKDGSTHSNPTKYTVEDAITFSAATDPSGYKFKAWDPASITKGTTGNQTVTASYYTKVAKPTAPADFTYDGNQKTAAAGHAGYALSGHEQTDAGSYEFTAKLNADYCWDDGSFDDVTVGWKINPASVTVPGNPASKTYNGATQTATVSGGRGYTVTANAGGKDVGSYDVTYALSSTKNYKWSDNTTEDKTVKFAITALTATLSWANTSLTYTGSAQKPTCAVSNLCSGDNCTVTVGGEQTDAGTDYTATASSLSNANYQLPASGLTKSFTIGKATLTVTANAKASSVAYGSAAPGYTLAYAGWKASGDTEAMITTKPTASTDYTTSKAAGSGTYYYTPSGGSALTNYSYSYQKGTGFTVDKASVAVPTAVTGLTYDRTEKTGVSNIPSASVATQSGDAANQTAAGSYTTTYALNDTTNYKWASGTGAQQSVTWMIAKKTVGLSWGTTTFTYNGSTQAPSCEATGVVSGDTCTVTVTGGAKDYSASAYTATASSLSNANYQLPASGLTKTFTIGKKGLTVTATINGKADNTTSIAFGDAAPTYGVSYAGFAESEDDSALTTKPTAKCTYVAGKTTTGKVGTYTVTPSGGVANNYSFDYVSHTFTVDRAKSATEPTVADRIYTGSSQNGYSPKGSNTTLSGDTSATAKGEYTFYSEPTANYAWSDGTFEKKSYTWTMAAASISAVTLSPAATYDGQPHQPTVMKVKANSKYFTDATTGWDVTYTRNDAATTDFTSAGTITVTVTGKANLTGSTSPTYKINKATLTDVSVTQNGTLTYTGSAQTPTVTTTASSKGGQTVTFMYRTKSTGSYSATMPTVTAAGTHTIYYKASAANHNDVTGSFTVTVDPASITAVTLKATSVTYDGQAHKPQVSNVTANGVTFTSAATGWSLMYSRDGSNFSTAEGFDFTTDGLITVKATGEVNLTGTATATFDIKTTEFTWIGKDDDNWTTASHWESAGRKPCTTFPGQGDPYEDTHHVVTFPSGKSYRVLFDGTTRYYINHIEADATVALYFHNTGINDWTLLAPRMNNPQYYCRLTLDSDEPTAGATGFNLGNVGIPSIHNELHVIDHRRNLPAGGAIGFGADNALMTFTNCKFGQDKGSAGYVSLVNDSNTRPVRLAITNTEWIAEFAASNALGRAANVTIANHSNVRMGMVADRFGGTFTIDNSLAAFNNVGPNASPAYYGDTVALTGLNVSGEDSKFVLSGNATLNGELHFDMPADGFANDIDTIENPRVNTYYAAVDVKSLDVAFAGKAPVAIMKDFDLSGTKLTVDATAIAEPGTYPLVAAGSLTGVAGLDIAVTTRQGLSGGVQHEGNKLNLVIWQTCYVAALIVQSGNEITTNRYTTLEDAFAGAADGANVTNVVMLLTNVVTKSVSVTKDVTFQGDVWEVALPKFTVSSGKTLTVAGGYIGVDAIDGTCRIVGGKYVTNTTFTVASGYHYAKLASIVQLYYTYSYQVIVGAAQDVPSDEVVLPALKGDDDDYVGEIRYTLKDLEEKGITGTTAEIVTNLNKKGANQNRVWENLVLGLSNDDPDAVAVLKALQTSNANMLKLKLDGLNIDDKAGATVRCRVMYTDKNRVTWKTDGKYYTPAEIAEQNLPESGVRYYRVEIEVIPAK